MKSNSFLPRAAMMLLVMMLSTVTAWATITGTGTKSDPYLISSAEDWNTLAENVKGGTTYEGKYLQLGTDITVSTMVGTYAHNFMGMFDGAGHKLTFNYGTYSNLSTEYRTAPFHYVDGVTIVNLHVAGSIRSNAKYDGGLVGELKGNCLFRNCRVSVSIYSQYSDGEVSEGGFVGYGGSNASITFKDCLFDGRLTGSVSGCSGFVGEHWCPLYIYNCLFAPSSINYGSKSGTFARKGVTTIENSYYTQVFYTAQGIAAPSTGAELATLLGSAWEFDGEHVVPIMDDKNLGMTTITGIRKYYTYIGSPINLSFTLTDIEGEELTEGTHYTTVLKKGDDVVTSINGAGDYTLIISAIDGSGYNGSRIVNIPISEDPLCFSIDNDYVKGEPGYYYVKMPSSGTKTLELSMEDLVACGSSFMIYDDGGKAANYSAYTDGSLIIKVPETGTIQLQGSACTFSRQYDYLTIYESATSSTYLGSREKYGDKSGSSTEVNLTSDGNSVRLYLKATYFNGTASGVSLKVNVLDPTIPKAVTVKTVSGGSVSANPVFSQPDGTVTLTATPDEGYMLNAISVKDAHNNNVAVTWTQYANTATFTMPATAATVTPEFVTYPTISIQNPQQGGEVVSDLSAAIPGTSITLTATPSSGYVATGFSVKDANNNTVAVAWDYFANTATFTMPVTSVTVVPAFTNDLTVNSLSVNIPKTGSKTITVPNGVASFKLYDDGGANSDYSNYCDGYLSLTAPQGYKFLITGNVHSDTGYQRMSLDDYLTIYDGVYDGSGNDPSYLGDEEKWGLRDAPGHDVGGIHPTGQSVTFYFHSDKSATRSGVNLTVTLVDVTTPLSITRNNTLGGSISAPESAIPFSTVTVTATPNSGYAMNSIIVKDANNQTIDVDWSLYSNTATFMMPPTAVTVTSTFTNDISNISINMPKTGHQSVVVLQSATTFKVYDDGGPSNNYSSSCRGYLTLVAPIGYRVQLKGTIETEDASNELCDYLTVYDGVYNGKGDAPNYLGSKEKFGGEMGDNIGTITSNGRRMTLYFYSTWSDEYTGLDLTASLVEATERDIVINQAAGGNMVATPAKAVTEQVVTLTSTTNSEYTLTGLSVKDANNNDVHVNWNAFDNTATFSMPETAVTVTPTYTHSVTSEGLSVNMPVTGIKTVIIPENVKSFKVYDDGGANGNYTLGSDCHLKLVAPENYIMKVTGSVTTDAYGISFGIWDNPNQTGKLLVNNGKSKKSGIPNDLGILTSTGNGLYLDFFASDHNDVSYSGLDITVTLINTLADCNVAIEDVVGGSVVATPNHGKYKDNISLTATPATGYVLNGITAEDANHFVLTVNGGEWYSNNTASFSMNGTDVTVTPSFTNDLTANGLSVNVPRSGNKTAIIPSSVQSFKVYDHAGSNGEYNAGCDGTLTLNAPDGYKFQLTGTIDAGGIYDYLSVYDGASTSATPLIENKTSDVENMYIVATNVGVISSNGNAMTIRFRSNITSSGGNLDLTVTVVKPNAPHAINVVSATNGSIESNVASAKYDETITLTATPAKGYALSSLSVMDANNNEVPLTWSMFENTATFVMPGTAVTITPEFASTNPLVINMPRRNTIHATIPTGVSAIKVYDDGGANGPFSPDNDGVLVLTAPSYSIMSVDGKMYARHNFDYFRIYNGDGTNTVAALQVTPEKDDVYEKIGPFVSDGNVMTFNFYAEYNSAHRAGLNIDVKVIPVLNLTDNADNAALIAENDGMECNVTLGRTLQSGGWNTFCAPFNMSIPSGWTVKTLSSSSLNNEELTLNFANAASIEAGKPYLVKVASTVANPVFNGVTVVDGTITTQTNDVDFVPVMNPTEIAGGDKSVLFVKGGNSLTYPTTTAVMNGFRAYFKLHDANSARSFTMDFGGGDEVTGIIDVMRQDAASDVFDLQGRRVAQPRKGAYIKNGKLIINK
jgi:hypothetical protein